MGDGLVSKPALTAVIHGISLRKKRLQGYIDIRHVYQYKPAAKT
jgi:hypothetical protein